MSKMAVYNLEWQDPPTADDLVVNMILAQLQNNPGKWARICRDRSQTALVAKWQKLGCDARHHRTNMGTTPARYDIYARWPLNKPATLPNTLRAEVAQSTASKQPPSEIKEAVAQGKALKPAPVAPGGYLANRAARGVPEDGNQI
jgi:hypothetical protein